MSDNKRKCMVICLLALFIGLMGIVLPEQDDIAFEIVLNNTNLAPTLNGTVGTGERVNNTDYYANNSAIQLLLYANSSPPGIVDINVYINDTPVQNYDSSSAMINQSAALIIPKFSKYKVVFTNYHHYEWREYPILSGKNGTLTINQSFINNDIAIEYVVNNTDLYNNGRKTGVNYTANASAIQLFLIFHVLGSGAAQVIDSNLSINGTVVEDRDFRTSAGVGIHEHFSITAHIPKGAAYNVTNSSNMHDIEWREYPILTGKNGTLSINQTVIGNTNCDDNNDCSINNLVVNSLGKNDTFNQFGVNIFLNSPFISSSGTLNTTLDLNTGTSFELKAANSSNGFSGSIFGTENILQLIVGDGSASEYNLNPGYAETVINGTRIYRYNDTHFDMGGANLTNCANCGGNQNLSQVLTQGNDAENKSIENISSIDGLTFESQNKSYKFNKITNWYYNGTNVSSGINANSDLFSYILQGNHPNINLNLVAYRNIGSVAGQGFNFFYGQRARGFIASNGTAFPDFLQKDDIVFRIAAAGWDNSTSGFSGSRSIIDFVAEQNWSTTSNPMRMDFYTTDNASIVVTKKMSIYANGSIQIYKFAGSSKTYLCQENGFVTAGTPGC